MVEKLNDIIDIDKIRFADWIQNGETQTHEEVEEEVDAQTRSDGVGRKLYSSICICTVVLVCLSI